MTANRIKMLFVEQYGEYKYLKVGLWGVVSIPFHQGATHHCGTPGSEVKTKRLQLVVCFGSGSFNPSIEHLGLNQTSLNVTHVTFKPLNPLNVHPGSVFVVSSAVRRLSSERSEDGGDALEAAAERRGERHAGRARGPEGLGAGRLEEADDRRSGHGPRPHTGNVGLRGEVRPRRGGRPGGCGPDLAVPRLTAGGGAIGPGEICPFDWPRREAPDPSVQSPMADGPGVQQRTQGPLDCRHTNTPTD